MEFTILHEECAVLAECTAKLDAKTGVEMEALTGVSVALLTIYDMCKAIDKTMEISDIHLVYKEGGKSGTFTNHGHRSAVVAVSGVKNSGKTTLIAAMLPHLTAAGLKVATVKHDGHSFQADPEGTDTGIHMEAGAWGTAIFDGEKYKVVRRDTVEERELIARFPDADLVLLEGFKHSTWPEAGAGARGQLHPERLRSRHPSGAGHRSGPHGGWRPLHFLDGQAAAQVVLDYLKGEGRL